MSRAFASSTARGDKLAPRLTAAVLLSALSQQGCAAAVESSKLEDQARREVPIAICLKSLERYGSAGVVPALKPPDYWSLLLPSYDADTKTIDPTASDCTGRPVLASAKLQGAAPTSGKIPATDEQALIAPVIGGFQAVWLRTHQVDGDAAGPIALVRPLEGQAEVYAVGIHRGAATKPRFELERMGSKMVLTATDSTCADPKTESACDVSMTVLLMSAGQLIPAAHFATDRLARTPQPGGGHMEYRLSARPEFTAEGLQLLEQVVVSDSNQVGVQKSTLERNFELQPDGRLISKQASIWERIAPRTPAANGSP